MTPAQRGWCNQSGRHTVLKAAGTHGHAALVGACSTAGAVTQHAACSTAGAVTQHAARLVRSHSRKVWLNGRQATCGHGSCKLRWDELRLLVPQL